MGLGAFGSTVSKHTHPAPIKFCPYRCHPAGLLALFTNPAQMFTSPAELRSIE